MNYNQNYYSIDIAINTIAKPIETLKKSYKCSSDRNQRFPSEQQSCLQNSKSSYKNHQSGNDLENHHLQSNIFYKKYCKYKKKYLDAKKENNMKGGADPKIVKPYNKISDEFLQTIDQAKVTKRVLAVCEKQKINPLESSIIDIGSGHGDLSLSLSFYFNRVYGFDISPDMLEESEKNKKRLQELRDDFNPDKVIFNMGSFYERLLIEAPVNVILLNNAIHYAEENSVKIIIDNLLEHLNKDGIIIILEPERDSMFGDTKLNQPGELRDKKLKKINDVRSEIREYLENSTQKVKTSFFNHITDKDGKIRKFMIVIKKN